MYLHWKLVQKLRNGIPGNDALFFLDPDKSPTPELIHFRQSAGLPVCVRSFCCRFNDVSMMFVPAHFRLVKVVKQWQQEDSDFLHTKLNRERLEAFWMGSVARLGIRSRFFQGLHLDRNSFDVAILRLIFEFL